MDDGRQMESLKAADLDASHDTRHTSPITSSPLTSSPVTVALETLGCKVNQYESSYFLEVLRGAGFQCVSFRERADIYIVHSCAVTSKASFQTRQLLRRAKRLNPLASVLVAGCSAQLDSEHITAEALATHVLGNAEKFDLLRWIERPGTFSGPCMALSNPRLYHGFPPLPVTRMHTGRARAVLKLQDGCDTFCSYCVVPYTRGKSRSLPPGSVREQMDRFVEHGYREVVLTGIHLGQWGRDLDPRLDLAGLLKLLSRGPLPPRIRLSSLEPMEWSEDLLGLLGSLPWVCSHFHVPLQSGDREVLERMHRPYTPDAYADVVQRLRALFPDAALGADVLVGFPGETERHFERTVQLIERLPLTYLHVFPFSPRPGTLASGWKDRATGAELKRRAQALQSLGLRKKKAFQARFIGEWLEVLAEGEVAPGTWRGTTRNYLQVLFGAGRPLIPGSLVRVRAGRLTEQGLEADGPATLL